MEEYLGGVEKHIGLAAVKVYEGMQMQCCDAPDSDALSKVPNNGGYETTPKEEWKFVVNPDLAETYPGGRRPTLLAAPQHAARRCFPGRGGPAECLQRRGALGLGPDRGDVLGPDKLPVRRPLAARRQETDKREHWR